MDNFVTLFTFKRNASQPHAYDSLEKPLRFPVKGYLTALLNNVLNKDPDFPRTLSWLLPEHYYDPNVRVPLGILRADERAKRILSNGWLGRKYDRYKVIPCIRNLAIQLRCLEQRAPPGFFQPQAGYNSSCLGEEYEWLTGTLIWHAAQRFVDSDGEPENTKLAIADGATFTASSNSYISFKKVHHIVWLKREFTNGRVCSVELEHLRPLFEEGVPPAIHLGDVVRLDVEGSHNWHVLVTELLEPDSVCGSFLCVGRGVRLFTLEDVRSLPGCDQASMQLHSNEVLLSGWRVSFQVGASRLSCTSLVLLLCIPDEVNIA